MVARGEAQRNPWTARFRCPVADYLQPVGPWGKRFAIVAMVAVSLLGAILTARLVASMIERRSLHFQGKPLWVGACVVAVLTAASGWLAIRLLSGQRSINGVTVMPVWFIEAFGALFLVGMVVVLFTEHAAIGVPGAIGVGVSMLLIRWQVRQRLREQTNTAADESQAPR